MIDAVQEKAIDEIRSYANPSKQTAEVMKAVATIFELNTANWDWNKARLILQDSVAFKQRMLYFDIRGISRKTLCQMQRFEKSSLNCPGCAR